MSKSHHAPETVLAASLAAAAQQVELGGRYAHYKSPDLFYEVVGFAILEATDEPAVLYRAQYGEQITFARSLMSWLEFVDMDGVMVPRFTQA